MNTVTRLILDFSKLKIKLKIKKNEHISFFGSRKEKTTSHRQRSILLNLAKTLKPFAKKGKAYLFRMLCS